MKNVYFNVIVSYSDEEDSPYKNFIRFTFNNIDEAMDFANEIMLEWDCYNVEILRLSEDD